MARKAGPDHEFMVLPQESSVSLLDITGQTRLRRAQPSCKPNSKAQDLSKHLGMQLPGVLRKGRWASLQEHPKIAIYDSRSMAALNSLLHLIPLAAAVILIVLFYIKWWAGGASDNGTSLQFAAKLHELLMQASLVDVLLFVIRSQAVDGFIPLGALSGAAKAPQLSYLWSVDFLSAITSGSFNLKRKIIFVSAALGLLLMTAVVGPSSAVLMIPRPGMPHTDETITRYMNASEAAIFPLYMNNDTVKMDLARRNELDALNGFSNLLKSEQYNGQVLKSFAWRSNYSVPRYISPREYTRVAYMARSLGKSWTIVTLPTILSARQLFAHSSKMIDSSDDYDELYHAEAKSANARWTMRTPQPVVLVRCSDFMENARELYYYHNDNSKSPLPKATELFSDMLEAKINDSAIPPKWISAPDGSKSLLVLSYLKPDNNQKTVCTVSIFWHTTLTSLTPVNYLYRVDISHSLSFEPQIRSNMTDIAVDPDFMNSMGALCDPYHPSDQSLALCLAAAISWIPGYHKESSAEGGDDFDQDILNGYDRSEPSLKAPTTIFQINVIRDGYGYGATGTSIQLSLAVMMAYCLIALTYVTYTLITGCTSVAWDSATELMMLALQSKEPDGLGHISVGLDSMETFRKGVGIRVFKVEDNSIEGSIERLELVFQDDDKVRKRELTKVVRGTPY